MMIQFFIGFVVGVVFALLILSVWVVTQEEEEENSSYKPDTFEQDQEDRRKSKWH